MPKLTRPKYPKPDKGQRETIQELRDAGCIVIETHMLPGTLDYLVIRSDFKAAVFVEHKNLGQPFRPAQIKIFEMAGIMDCPYHPPLDCVVMAAHRAYDILAHLQMDTTQYSKSCSGRDRISPHWKRGWDEEIPSGAEVIE